MSTRILKRDLKKLELCLELLDEVSFKLPEELFDLIQDQCAAVEIELSELENE